MTTALCFYCGATKFGAICPCHECQRNSTGNIELDIAFSDHQMSESTLQGFGEVVRALRANCDDEELRFWSFLHYVSTNHPELMAITISDELRNRCEDLIASANPAPVVYEESSQRQTMREFENGDKEN